MTRHTKPNNRPLTARQAEVLDVIARLEVELGQAPSYRELARELGLVSTHTVWCHLDALHSRGALRIIRSPGGGAIHRMTRVDVGSMPLETLRKRATRLRCQLLEIEALIADREEAAE